MNEAQASLNEFITDALTKIVENKGLDVTVRPDTDMFATDILDSLQFLTLITQLEEKFGLDIDFSAFDPEEFRTVNGFVSCLTR
jgi:D-alanine--poly(phosphoribitol) ligase subunit 2